MHKNFTNRIVNDEKNINAEIFNEYFKYQNPSILIKDIYNANQTRNEQIVNQVNDALIDLRNTVKKKKIPENENPLEVIKIVERILDFSKQQKVKDSKY